MSVLEKVLIKRFKEFYSNSNFDVKWKEGNCYLVFCSFSREGLNKWKLTDSLEFVNNLEKEFNIIIYTKLG